MHNLPATMGIIAFTISNTINYTIMQTQWIWCLTIYIVANLDYVMMISFTVAAFTIVWHVVLVWICASGFDAKVTRYRYTT